MTTDQQRIDELAEAIRLLCDGNAGTARILARHVQDSLRRPAEEPVTGHDTVWLMEHEG